MAITCPKCHLSNPDTSHFCANCGTSLAPSKDIRLEVTETLQSSIKELTTGSTFSGRYQIIEELAQVRQFRGFRWAKSFIFNKSISESSLQIRIYF